MPLGMDVGLSPGDFVLDGDPVFPPQQGAQPPSNFRPISIVPKRLDASRCHSVWREASAQCGALPVVASFVALEQQIVLVKTRSESV